MRNRTKNVTILFIFLLSVSVFPVAVDTFLNLHRFAWHVLADNNYRTMICTEIKKDRGGNAVLPEKVQIMIELLQSNNVNVFRFSRTIGENEEIRQRLVEGAYPLQFSETSHYLIYLDQEPLSPECKPAINKRGVGLAYCS